MLVVAVRCALAGNQDRKQDCKQDRGQDLLEDRTALADTLHDQPPDYVHRMRENAAEAEIEGLGGEGGGVGGLGEIHHETTIVTSSMLKLLRSGDKDKDSRLTEEELETKRRCVIC